MIAIIIIINKHARVITNRSQYLKQKERTWDLKRIHGLKNIT